MRLQIMKRQMMNTIQQLVPFAILGMWATIVAYPGVAQQAAQPTFPSAAEATQNLFQAVQGNNAKTVANILGGPTELAASGDPDQDKLDREMFIQKYQQMHRLGHEPDGSMTLYIGAENWPFPIPLVQKNGAWRFDSDAGEKEILFRRIGENELTAIDICHELVVAEKQLRSNPNAKTQVDSRLASLVSAAASGSASAKPVLIQGYYFRVAAKQPTTGFAFIAYPAEYRSTGVKTFIVTDNDVVNEKDLGANTAARAKTIPADYKGGWDAADEK
jgi:Protein of unknown function (DUF2950)